MDITEDHILNQRVRLRQPKKGYRAGMDAVFLAASIPAKLGDTILDLGTGVGAAALAVLARVPGCRVIGLEREADIAALAWENALLNNCQDCFKIITGTIPDILFDEPYAFQKPGETQENLCSHPDNTPATAHLAWGTYDAVMANPPYYPEHAHTAAAAGYKRSAHVQEAGASINTWVETAARAVKPGGSVTFIYPARQEAAIRRLFAEYFQHMVVLELRSYADSPEALRVIIQGRTIPGESPKHCDLEPLVLHTKGRDNTPEAEAILRTAAPTKLAIL